LYIFIGQGDKAVMPASTLKTHVFKRIHQSPNSKVWTPVDFCDLGSRAAVDKTLQRMVASKELHRVDRGLYDQARTSKWSGQPAAADYLSVIDAVGRRDQVRVLLDGMTAANDLGLTTAVPAQVIVHTDGRLRPITLGKLTLQFKLTAPSKLYWASHPAMRVVQALYWLRDSLKGTAQSDQDDIQGKLIRLLRDSKQGPLLRSDLRSGLHTVPSWMQQQIRGLISKSEHATSGAQA
jgi:hypothetical protein